jgi:hypothetical protein
MDHIKNMPPEIGWYIAGFVDGEGSFSASFRKRVDHKITWQTTLCFNVAQRDKTVLALIKHHMGCGRLQGRKDGVWYFIVQNPQAIKERVIPFFERFQFLSAKSKRNFALFKKIATMVSNGRHLSREGLLAIAEIRENLNEGRGRKRKYTLTDVQNTSDSKILRDYTPNAASQQ